MSDAKTVVLYPAASGATIAGVPAVVMEVRPAQAKRMLAFTPAAFTETKPDDDAHLAQFRQGADGTGHFVVEDFSERIDELVPPKGNPEPAAPEPPKEPI